LTILGGGVLRLRVRPGEWPNRTQQNPAANAKPSNHTLPFHIHPRNMPSRNKQSLEHAGL
jgi:hypothetical protein